MSLLYATLYDKLYYIRLNKKDTDQTAPGLYLILENIDNFTYKWSQILNVNWLSETIFLANADKRWSGHPVPLQA